MMTPIRGGSNLQGRLSPVGRGWVGTFARRNTPAIQTGLSDRTA